MSALSFLRDVFADQACYLCGEESKTPICSVCTADFRLCDADISDSRLLAGIARGFSAFWYEGTVRQAVLQMKTRGEYRLAVALAELLKNACIPLHLPRGALFIPVPRYGESRQASLRRFPSAACRILADASGGDDGYGILTKIRRTPLQTELTDDQRLTNVMGVFAMKDAATSIVKNRIVVIVDDVLTTGATIFSAQRCILQACPNQCLYLTLARSRATIRAGL